jgi:hypothetical protein
MNATLPPVFTRWIAPLIVATERDLEKDYLGDDLEAICQFAVSTGDAVLIASAALPPTKRREAVLHWRKKQVRNLLAASADFRRYIDGSPGETLESILEGKISFAALDAEVVSFKEQAEKLRMEKLNASKAALRAALRGALMDCDGSEEGTILPGYVAILANGEVGLFHRRGACVEWARASRQRYFLGVLDGASGSFHPAPEGDE